MSMAREIHKYIVGKYHIYLYEVKKQINRQHLVSFSYLFRIECTHIFIDNARMLCLSCNIYFFLNCKILPKVSETDVVLIFAPSVRSITSALILMPFLTVLSIRINYKVPEKLYKGHVQITHCTSL